MLPRIPPFAPVIVRAPEKRKHCRRFSGKRSARCKYVRSAAKKKGDGEMFKSIGKAAVYLALLLCTAAISGLVTYTVTVNILKNRAAGAVQTVAAENVKPKTEENADSEQETKKSVPPARQNCYVVRLRTAILRFMRRLTEKKSSCTVSLFRCATCRRTMRDFWRKAFA